MGTSVPLLKSEPDVQRRKDLPFYYYTNQLVTTVKNDYRLVSLHTLQNNARSGLIACYYILIPLIMITSLN